MKHFNFTRPLITSIGAIALWFTAMPANATTVSLTYDIHLEFVGDHVRKLIYPINPDEPYGDVGVCNFGEDCYPEGWRPNDGPFIDTEVGNTVNLNFSIDLTARPDSSGWNANIISCEADYAGCSYLSSGSYHNYVSAFDATTGKIELSGTDFLSFGKKIDLFSPSVNFASEFGQLTTDYCKNLSDAPDGFCGYWDYEAHFKVVSYAVDGLPQRPVSPVPAPESLPLLASALFAIAALRKRKFRSKA